ncbi:MAG: hypothetical protein KC464_19100, partial [Myxococcales bacterium]|nr:hypothetical protein [Myxococcales bacterium]
MQELYTIDVVGAWLGIFLTFAILSFLYKDNPFYKLAEHLFVGVSLGYVVTQQYYNTLRPKLVVSLADGHLLAIIPLLLFIALLVKAMSKRLAWVGRYPLAFVVALFAGIQINAVAQAELGAQIKRAAFDLDAPKVDVTRASEKELGQLPGVIPSTAHKIVLHRDGDPATGAPGQALTSIDEMAHLPELTDAERALMAGERGSIHGLDARASAGDGGTYWFGLLSNILLLAGTLASLLYFYFSVAHKGVIGRVSRFGVWVLMIGFGASFGYTVQGRIALAIGRAQDVMGTRLSASDARQVQGPWAALVSVAIIIAGIA